MARVVVVGGGFAGAASAARLAKLGHRVTVVERLDRIGGALGFLEADGFRWDTGPTSTALPAVVRDLFGKSGRRLERELELVPVALPREHRFADGSVLPMPSGRADQLDAVTQVLGEEAGRAWVERVHSYAGTWDLLRRGYLERRWSPGHADPALGRLLRGRTSLRRSVARSLADPRLRSVALSHAVLDGQDPGAVPAWFGVVDYVEQKFGTWTVPGGMGLLAELLERRLAERGVEVLTGTTVRDIVLRHGRAVAVDTTGGELEADLVVCAVDPRGIPALASRARRATAAAPPSVCHLGLAGEVPFLPHEVLLHGDPTLVVRTGGRAPAGSAAWTVLSRGRLAEDVLVTLARRGVDVRDRVRVRVDRTAEQQVGLWGGSPYGVLWPARSPLTRRAAPASVVEGVSCVGAHVAGLPGLPFVGLTAAVLADEVGRA